jgi:Ssp1 endopeptidase immunity protein Rap1a
LRELQTLFAITCDNVANFFAKGCRDVLSDDPSKTIYVEAGICAGAVKALVFAGGAACAGQQRTGNLIAMAFKAPPTSTPEQAIRIIMRFIDAHPERTHELFYVLAVQALMEAWPCPQ